MSLPAGVFNKSYAQDMATIRTKTHWFWLAVAIAFLIYLPQVANDYHLGVLLPILIWVIAAQGLNITLGYCGQISVAQSAFMAVGGYTSAILEVKLGVSFWWTLPCAALSAGLIGLVFGIPSLRVKGFYLALATLAAQIVIMWIILRWNDLTAGANGIKVPTIELGPLAFESTRQYYYIALAMAVLAVYFTFSLVRSKVGRAFMAIRDNDLSAEALGINVFRYKLLSFFIGCAFAGVAGSLYVHYVGMANVEQFTMWQAIWLLGMALIGGMGTVTGPIFGVIFIKGIEEITHNLTGWIGAFSPSMARGAGIGLPEVVFGLVVIVFLMYDPYGLAHRWSMIKGYYRILPFAYQEKA